MFFYELHEGDEEIFSDVLLVRDDEMDPDEFFELVDGIRRRIQENYEDDTLIESIARELEREHGFIFVSDARLEASVHVSVNEDENRLMAIDDTIADSAEYRTIFAQLDPDAELDQN